MDAPLQSDDELTILDLLVVIAESWILLIFGPLLVGLAVLGLLHFMQDERYASEAILKLSGNEAALLQSARVIDPSIAESGFLSRFDGDPAAARKVLLEDRLTVTQISGVDYFRVSVTDNSPESAQSLLTTLIDQLISNSAPRGNDKLVLEERLNALERSRAGLNASLERLNTLYDEAIEGGPTSAGLLANASQSPAALIANIVRTEQEILATQIALQGSISPADIIQEPTLELEPLSRNAWRYAVLAAFGTGFALLLFALARASLMNAATDARSAEKIAQIKSAFWIGRSKAR